MNRRGKSLVELLVVISMLGVILGTTGTVIHRLMRTERAVETDLVWHRAVSNFAEQFRADVHAATAAELHDDGVRISLVLPAGVVTYSVQPRGIQRQMTLPDGLTQQDEFRCGEPGVRFTTQDDRGRMWATANIPRRTAEIAKSLSAPTPSRPEVRAALGRFVPPAPKEDVS